MVLTHRHRLQLQALCIAILIYILVFILLFFHLDISLFGIKIPDLTDHDYTPTQQYQHNTPVVWYPAPSSSSQSTSSQQSPQPPSQPATQPSFPTSLQQQTATQHESSTTPAQQESQHEASTPPHAPSDTSEHKHSHEEPSQSQTPTEPQQAQQAQYDAIRSSQKSPSSKTDTSSSRQPTSKQSTVTIPAETEDTSEPPQEETSHHTPQEHPEEDQPPQQASHQEHQPAQEHTLPSKPRRPGKDKWFRKDKSPSKNTQTESSTASHHLGKSLCQAAREYARNTAPARTQYTSGTHSGGGNAHKNAQSNAYETFIEKSNKAIVTSSYERQHYVYTSQYINTKMRVTYTTNRNGHITDIKITSSSGNAAIDNAIIHIIQIANLPPVPPEHPEPYITQTVSIYIRKAPGRDPLTLQLIRL